MLPTAIKRRLMPTIMCALLMAMLLLLTAFPHAAFAQTSPITIKRVLTGDTNNNIKTSFAPGDAIRYYALILNSRGQPTKVTLKLVSKGPSGPNSKVIFNGKSDITLPTDGSAWYAQSTIPKDAMAGKYEVDASVAATEVNAKGKGTFTVTSGGLPGNR